MTRKNWVLIDAENQTAVENLTIAEQGVTLVKKRLKAGLSAGVDVLEIDNGVLSLTILPTRGMGIWRGQCGTASLRWQSPVHGPVHPAFVPVADGSGVGWLYGFDEWFVRCGLENNGAPQFNENGQLIYSLHGRIANTPASRVEITVDSETGEILVEGTVYESRLFSKHLELKTRYAFKAGETGFRLQDVATNLSASPKEIVLLYHINTGLPFVQSGSRLVVPFEEMAPRTFAAADDLANWNVCKKGTPGVEEVVYFFNPAADANGDTEVLFINNTNEQAIRLGFNKKQLPLFSFWKSRLPDEDGFVVGIEPSVNFPNTTGFESRHGRTVRLAPKESREFDLKFAFTLNKEETFNAEQSLLKNYPAVGTIHKNPKPEWSE
ncbi:MAG: aldose 1-epimerase family protein [Planctomycetaceae bacterium]|nr:aldose 1-epimerase family protein [Planctomycetaceae bacterium]